LNACVESSDARLLLELHVALFDLDFFNLIYPIHAPMEEPMFNGLRLDSIALSQNV